MTTGGDNDDMESSMGFIGGVCLGMDLTEHFGTNLEVLYTQKGAERYFEESRTP